MAKLPRELEKKQAAQTRVTAIADVFRESVGSDEEKQGIIVSHSNLYHIEEAMNTSFPELGVADCFSEAGIVAKDGYNQNSRAHFLLSPWMGQHEHHKIFERVLNDQLIDIPPGSRVVSFIDSINGSHEIELPSGEKSTIRDVLADRDVTFFSVPFSDFNNGKALLEFPEIYLSRAKDIETIHFFDISFDESFETSLEKLNLYKLNNPTTKIILLNNDLNSVIAAAIQNLYARNQGGRIQVINYGSFDRLTEIDEMKVFNTISYKQSEEELIASFARIVEVRKLPNVEASALTASGTSAIFSPYSFPPLKFKYTPARELNASSLKALSDLSVEIVRQPTRNITLS